MIHNASPGVGYSHTPVLCREIYEFVSSVLGTGENIFIDCTLGEGGHSEFLLKAFQEIRIIGFDRDREVLEIARQRLKGFCRRIEFINDNFSDISRYLEDYKNNISGFLYDFGLSSYHFEKSDRGFSLYKDEPLDMRFDSRVVLTAHYIVNNYSEEELREVIREYGEERYAKRIARNICKRRKEKIIETTKDLAELISQSVRRGYNARNIHPATRVFQALRIAVNEELWAIKESLKNAYKYLAPDGIIIAISFHSLEDRIVKDIFRRLERGCICSEESQFCECKSHPLVRVLTKKPITPQVDEISRNRRSRSAKLRVCKRL